MSKKLRKYQKSAPLLTQLSKLQSFKLEDATRVGMSHPVLLKLLKDGKVVRLQRGIYSVAGFEPVGTQCDFALMNKKFAGQAVVGGLTALSYYELIAEIPTKIWVLVPPNVRTIDKRYRLLRTNKDLKIAVKNEGDFRIVSIERALVDSLIFSSKIGERIAITAILKAIRSKVTSSDKLFETAKKLSATKILNKHWQLVLAGLSQ